MKNIEGDTLVEVSDKKTEKILTQFTSENGEVDVQSLASHSAKQLQTNQNLKKILWGGMIFVIVAIGLMVGSVVIGIELTKDLKLSDNVLVSTSNQKVQVEPASYQTILTIYDDDYTISNVKSVQIPITVNGINSTFNFEIHSYIRTPGVKIVYIGSIYSLEITRNGYEVFLNDPNTNPFGIDTTFQSNGRKNVVLEKNVIVRESRNLLKISSIKRDGNQESHPQYNPPQGNLIKTGKRKPATNPYNLVYYGGPIIPTPKVAMILWNNNVRFQTDMSNFYTDLTATSKIYTFLQQYNVNGYPHYSTGSFLGIFNANQNSATIKESDIQTVLMNGLSSGLFPAADANILYVFHFPPNTKIYASDGSSNCVQWCGFHSTLVYNGIDISYTVLPDLGDTGCNGGGCGTHSDFQNLCSVSSHEFFESITDPAVGLACCYAPPLAWYNNRGGEIGDLCNGNSVLATLNGNPYYIQKEYSNTLGGCVNPAA